MVSWGFTGLAGVKTTLSGLSNFDGAGVGVVVFKTDDAPTTQILPSTSSAAAVAISLAGVPNLVPEIKTPVFE